MSSVHFYTLSSERYASPEDKLTVACRLTEKAVRHDHSVYILTESPTQSQQLDDLLWQFRDTAFVPHRVAHSSDLPNERVIIADSTPPAHFSGMLINLSAQAIESANRFSRVNELVGPDETSLVEGRERYRHYKTQGVEIVTNKI